MGNQAPTRDDSEHLEDDTPQQAKVEQEAAAVQAEKQRRRALHLRESEDEYGRITCSCGHRALDEHSYNLHIECRCPNLKPADGSGWPARHFETVPYVANTQRAVVSKGAIENASFTWISLAVGYDDQEVRKAVSLVPVITAEVGAVAGEEALVSSLVGIASDLWSCWDVLPPEELAPFTDKCAGDSGQVLLPSIQGGELILLVKSKRADVCYEVSKKVLQALGPHNVASSDYTQGFGYMGQPPYGGRDLTGFVDGTRNPDHLLRAIADEVVIFPDDHPNDEKHVGGTYMFAGRFVHDLPKFPITSYYCCHKHLYHGWIYITPAYVCFEPALLPNESTRITTPLTSIASIARVRGFKYIPGTDNALSFTLKSGVEYFFNNFTHRDGVIANIVQQAAKFGHRIQSHDEKQAADSGKEPKRTESAIVLHASKDTDALPAIGQQQLPRTTRARSLSDVG